MEKLDLVHIFRKVFDSASSALKVKLAATEMSMELDHTDGDSVTSHPAKLTASVTGVTSSDNGSIIIPELDCSSIRSFSISVNGTGSVALEVSLSDSEDSWTPVPEFQSMEILFGQSICARRLRVRSNDVIGDVHLAGRS